MDKGIYSAIDASINRALEGLRVCEDLLRFTLRLPGLSGRCKDLRHRLVEASRGFPRGELLRGRDVEGDLRKFDDHEGEMKRDSLEDVFSANSHRAIEAVRSLEEFGKVTGRMADNPFQEIRFALYSLEKEALPLIMRQDRVEAFDRALYVILDHEFVPGGGFAAAVTDCIRGGAAVIQLRMKGRPLPEILIKAREVSALCKEAGNGEVLFFVNDHPDIAVLSGADGVHLGQEDLPVREARRLVPADMLIGISTHSEPQVRAALGEGPDYIAIGPVFDTVSKDGSPLKGIGTGVISAVRKEVRVPIVAIGGIDEEGAQSVIGAGADAVAVISSVYRGNTVFDNCRKLSAAISR